MLGIPELRSSLRNVREQYMARRRPLEYARSLGVTLGEDCRLLSLEPGTFGSEPWLVTLGDHVSITGGVRFATHDGGVWVFRKEFPDIDVFAPITIGNNVFIGLNALILPGSVVGSDSVIGAGSVVRGQLPGGAVYAGAPAREIRTIEDYRGHSMRAAMHVRSLSPDVKRAAVEKYLSHRETSHGRGD